MSYGVILTDNPWRYRNYSEAKNGAASSAMETMPLEDLLALAPLVEALGNPGGTVLGLWGTWPFMPEALECLQVWGFAYVSGFPWVKMRQDMEAPKPGVGYWTRGVSEFMLIGKRGKPKRRSKRDRTPVGLAVGDLERVLWAPKGKQHSEKPYDVHDWLDEMFPDVDKVELFARREHPGWDCFGLDLGHLLTPEGIVFPDGEVVM